jgi:putative hydrolase of the HAD superfamily
MTTVWVDNGSEQDPGDVGNDWDRSFIDYRVGALAPWLNHMLEEE